MSVIEQLPTSMLSDGIEEGQVWQPLQETKIPSAVSQPDSSHLLTSPKSSAFEGQSSGIIIELYPKGTIALQIPWSYPLRTASVSQSCWSGCDCKATELASLAMLTGETTAIMSSIIIIAVYVFLIIKIIIYVYMYARIVGYIAVFLRRLECRSGAACPIIRVSCPNSAARYLGSSAAASLEVNYFPSAIRHA